MNNYLILLLTLCTFMAPFVKEKTSGVLSTEALKAPRALKMTRQHTVHLY